MTFPMYDTYDGPGERHGRTTGGAEIVLLDTLEALDAAITTAETWPLVGLDVETAHLAPVPPPGVKERLDFNRLALRSVQFGDERVVFVIDCARLPDWRTDRMRALLTGPIRKVAHNKNFEYKVLALAAGIRVGSMVCTMQAERLLGLGLLHKSPSLASLVERYLGREMPKDVRSSFIEQREVVPLSEEQIRYAADDIDCMIPILREQEQRIARENQGKVIQFEWAAQRAFAEIEMRGFTLDVGRWQALLDAATARRDALHTEIFRLFQPAAIGAYMATLAAREQKRALLEAAIAHERDRGHEDKAAALEVDLRALPSWLKIRPNKETGEREPKKSTMWDFGKVLTSPMQLQQALVRLGVDVEDTNERTLLKWRSQWLGHKGAANYPTTAIAAIDRLLEFRGYDKKVTNYGTKWIDAISPVTGRIHAEYDTLKDTGRTGCGTPNIQNVPKRDEGKHYRKCFVAPPGKVLIPVDYSQLELRQAADLSGDRAMIAAFKSGEDFHTATAAQMFNVAIADVTKDQRRGAKAVNFGILFGIGRAKIAEDINKANMENGIEEYCTPEMGGEFLTKYHKTFPVLMKFLDKSAEQAQTEFYATTILGHRRRFTPPTPPQAKHRYATADDFEEAKDKYRSQLAAIGREGKSTPVQGSAACLAKYAVIDLERVLPAYDARIVAFVHDEIVVEADASRGAEVAAVVKATMEAVGNRFFKFVPCVAEAEVGTDWLAEHEEEAAA